MGFLNFYCDLFRFAKPVIWNEWEYPSLISLLMSPFRKPDTILTVCQWNKDIIYIIKSLFYCGFKLLFTPVFIKPALTLYTSTSQLNVFKPYCLLFTKLWIHSAMSKNQCCRNEFVNLAVSWNQVQWRLICSIDNLAVSWNQVQWRLICSINYVHEVLLGLIGVIDFVLFCEVQ